MRKLINAIGTIIGAICTTALMFHVCADKEQTLPFALTFIAVLAVVAAIAARREIIESPQIIPASIFAGGTYLLICELDDKITNTTDKNAVPSSILLYAIITFTSISISIFVFKSTQSFFTKATPETSTTAANQSLE